MGLRQVKHVEPVKPAKPVKLQDLAAWLWLSDALRLRFRGLTGLTGLTGLSGLTRQTETTELPAGSLRCDLKSKEMNSPHTDKESSRRLRRFKLQQAVPPAFGIVSCVEQVQFRLSHACCKDKTYQAMTRSDTL